MLERAPEITEGVCLSIIATERSLDLEANCMEDRDLLYLHLSHNILHFKDLRRNESLAQRAE